MRRNDRMKPLVCMGLTCTLSWIVFVAPVRADAPFSPLTSKLKREIVSDLSKTLEDAYVIDDVAKLMVAKLRDRLATGAYEKISDRIELAKALTDDLRAVYLDRHLAVINPVRFEEVIARFGEAESVSPDGSSSPTKHGPPRAKPHASPRPEKHGAKPHKPSRAHHASPPRKAYGKTHVNNRQQYGGGAHKSQHGARSSRQVGVAPGRHDMRQPGRKPEDGIAVARMMNRDGRTNIGFLELVEFAGNESGFRAIDRVMQSFDGADAVIIDLRESPGGDAEMVKVLSSYFFAERTHLVSTLQRKDENGQRATVQRWTTPLEMSKSFAELPLYILIGKKTFSAAESFAFGLKRTGRATLVGEATGGGGHTNAFFQLAGGFGASISVGRTFDPVTGEGWQSTGVTPDVACEEDHALYTALRAIEVSSMQRANLDPDREAVHQSLQRYATAWYGGDARGLKEVIGGGFAGRTIAGRGNTQGSMTAADIVKKTRDGEGLSTPRALRNREVTVFDVYGDAASAKLMLRETVHYMQLARAGSGWEIVGDSIVDKTPHG